ncbi:tryptophan synthase, alpha subunit [Sphaerochaeta pleomorpha str. Grapes]|uniref:Tryptophan synthase alpha chain n=1 Tax=Sphaerochaeta pleomorpha (strain ATCC BAA-1885 / DSM 22778 / Grapes) TaxID=158190 RepID=G8QQS9_SPHPG|nr:tryptophan synthase subunit alpha [Sphaerochaeta pleomorpha]AEV28710.1 tryptophan synthase, alpha subunit [Sphaerochaeta pleomorpha str. Grapes]
MSRIANAFLKGKAFIPFITCGDPDLETTKALVLAMEKSGADLIELGIPFSDPIAEGPVIQKADKRALQSGTTADRIFSLVAEIRLETDIPLVFMTYINPIFTYGKARFLTRCKEVGIDGIIVPDLPYEEQDELKGFCSESGVTLISMIAPTSRERIQMVAKEAEGFLYCVSSLGVTGERSAIGDAAMMMVEEAKKATTIPCCIGFGISNAEQAKAMASFADGVIVGSAIVRLIAENGKDSIQPVSKFVSAMKTAIATTA